MKKRCMLRLLVAALCLGAAWGGASCSDSEEGVIATGNATTEIESLTTLSAESTVAPADTTAFAETQAYHTGDPSDLTVAFDTGTVPETTSDLATELATESVTEEITEPVTEPETEKEDVIVMAEREKLNFSTNVSIAVSGSTANAKTASGLTYTAAGYQAVSGSTFTINKNFSIAFNSADFSESFNRFTIGYTSTQPLQGTITYEENGSTRTDTFFLEAGTDTFSCLIENYLSRKMGARISGMTFETCNDQDANFAICVLKTNQIPVYTVSANTYYIESNRYKVGIQLNWGGGINYIYDKQTPNRALRNLINRADTGRLVQQSYYGTQGNSEYQPGDYNNTHWSYNPVQGGDVYQNHSRLVDIVVEEYSVYIKSQPQDWSLDNRLTPSYMENTYTVYEDRIRVDNRFVDFSNWTHRYASQELPAFYTLSYFETFTWYNGSKPWTDASLTSRSDLNFWGDPAYHNDCVFRMKYSNTETWCAWTNAGINYGIGLYVPNVDVFLAGRYEYNGSLDSTNGATNYVAPLNTMMMVSFQPIEYSYLIATGSISEIRSTFKQYRDFAANESLHNNYQSDRLPDDAITAASISFDSADKAVCVTPTNNAATEYVAAQQAIRLDAVTGEDVHVTINYEKLAPGLTANGYTKIRITYMIPTTASQKTYTAEVFPCAGNVTVPTATCSARTQVTADGQYHVAEFNVAGLAGWEGIIHAIRFDFFSGCAAGDQMFVRSIELA